MKLQKVTTTMVRAAKNGDSFAFNGHSSSMTGVFQKEGIKVSTRRGWFVTKPSEAPIAITVLTVVGRN